MYSQKCLDSSVLLSYIVLQTTVIFWNFPTQAVTLVRRSGDKVKGEALHDRLNQAGTCSVP